MIDSKVDSKTLQTIYVAVRKFGQSAWNKNARLKQAGERRFLIKYPPNELISWEEWRQDPAHFAKK
jgi:hypothetical protein